MVTHSWFGCAAMALLGAVAQGQASPDAVAALVREARENSQVMAHLDHLVNRIGPRLTGSERLAKACLWARDTLRSFGMENARLEQWGTVPVGFDRGPATGVMRVSDAAPVALTFGTNPWTAGTQGEQSGHAALAPATAAELPAFAKRASGAWVVVPANAARGVASQISRLCADAGALGTVRSGGRRLRISGRMRAAPHPPLPEIKLLRSEYGKLVAHLAAGTAVQLTFAIENRFRKGPIPVHNVLAEIVGTERPDELVVVGAHIDSWDGATGTTDNGTGTATTLEAARLLMAAGIKPRRTIRFMLWTGEEQGLQGSRAYIKQHDDESARISAVLVHDGGTNYVAGIVGTKEQVPLFERIFAPVANLDPDLHFRIREVRALPRGIGSDHDSYLARGVPGFFWLQDGRAVYSRTHHTHLDTFDAAIPEYQRHSALVIALGALGIANLENMLPRPKSMVAQPNPAVDRRRLGVRLSRNARLTVRSVLPGSRAYKAGIEPGDVITAVDGQVVETTAALASALNSVGTKKQVHIRRGDKTLVVEVEYPPLRR